MNYSQALEHTIFRYLSGSHSYGLARSESDYDYRGIYMPTVNILLHEEEPVFEVAKSEEEDDKLYVLHKAFDLMLASNPSFLEFLFAPEECVVLSISWWEKIIANRHLFLSKRAQKSFFWLCHSADATHL